jgi:spore maturation protein CgeB
MSGYSIVILGLSITSSWGNGHATTYRGLVDRRGHNVLFLERDLPWYRSHRDLPSPPYGSTRLYRDLDELRREFTSAVSRADVVIVGSYVPEGVEVGRWVMETAGGVKAFYDIDTPVTLAKLAAGDYEYLRPELIPGFDLYLSFTGGPTLARLEREFGSPAARPLYCSVDPQHYRPQTASPHWDLGYLGTYSADRQNTLERLLLAPARRQTQNSFVVAGPQFPPSIEWPSNVDRIDHLPPGDHRSFYNRQRFTLNVTRADMIRAGWSPSVRLFEAAACATPIISDYWEGLEDFFEPDKEILIGRCAEDVVQWVKEMPETERRRIGLNARERVMQSHTAAHRARELEGYIGERLGCTSLTSAGAV